MKLIIAEKPTLARNIVSGIGKLERRDGYFIGEGYIVTWVFGHLFSDICFLLPILSPILLPRASAGRLTTCPAFLKNSNSS